jgi:hypothetical protein
MQEQIKTVNLKKLYIYNNAQYITLKTPVLMKYTGYRSIENITREQVFRQSIMIDNGEIPYETLYTTCYRALHNAHWQGSMAGVRSGCLVSLKKKQYSTDEVFCRFDYIYFMRLQMK